jgi:F-type H+-transporting ATPase subunit alpha
LNNKHRATLDALKAGKLTDEITDVIQTVAKEFQQNITNLVKGGV